MVDWSHPLRWCVSQDLSPTFETYVNKNNGDATKYAEQELVDCVRQCNGCNGGLANYAYDWLVKSLFCTEQSYPYKAVDQRCKFNPDNVGATVTGHVDIPSGNEEALTNAIASVGPISVAIDASNWSFQLYKSGVYDEPNCSTSLLDHGVTAVGYGVDGGKKMFIVKNSWNTSWGLKGYIHMTRDGSNQCGIA